MANRYLVVSDLHLCDVEEHADGWKAYKGGRYLYDDEIARLIERFCAESVGSTATLVLNGDTFDFDLVTAVPESPPWPVTSAERRRGLDATAAKSTWKMELMLRHHPRFVAALAAYLAGGHRLVCVAGNHDRELHFPEVQRALVAAVVAAAGERGLDEGLVQFEPWFYLVPGEIYVEHGNQYDYYTSFRHLLDPVVQHDGEATIALPMGNLSNRYLMTQMGYFNPHASDFILSAFAYIRHWWRYYAFSRRGILFKWLFGSIAVVLRLLAIKSKLAVAPRDLGARTEGVAQRFGLSTATIRQLEALQRAPITSKLYRILRELWIDRLLIVVGMTTGTIALALFSIPLWLKLVVPLLAFPLAFAIYESLARGETIFSIEHELPAYARQIARWLGVKVVTFGHTHVPRLVPLGPDTTFVDTGTWAPIMHRLENGVGGGELVAGYRNYLTVECAASGTHVQLRCWDSGGSREDEQPEAAISAR